MQATTQNHQVKRYFSPLLFSTMIAVASTFSVQAIASGGFSDDSLYQQQQSVDHNFEIGKSIFKGRHQRYKKQKICLLNADKTETVKIRRSTIKSFKKGSEAALANSLYVCKQPQKAANNILNEQDMSLLLYYLNQRFSLKMTKG